jgi:hypothetical protein
MKSTSHCGLPVRWSSSSRFVVAALLAIGLGCATASLVNADEPTKRNDGKAAADAKPQLAKLFAHCLDGSLLRVELRDSKIPIKTQYGSLNIPVSDIRRIDFSVRIPEDVVRKVDAAIGKLGSNESEVRDAARTELLALERMAYPALLKAAASDDVEVSMSAEKLLAEIRERVPEGDLKVREFDVVFTDSSQFAGTVELQSLRVETVSLGPQELKLNVLNRIDAGMPQEEEVANPLPDPGNLTRYQGQIGKTFHFRITGAQPGFQQGTVWGTDFYTLDSHLGMAAVHAGVIRPGQTKVVSVVMMAPQNNFRGSSRNGINTHDWQQYPGAFKFKTIPNAANWVR